jgi:hypothetical protein
MAQAVENLSRWKNGVVNPWNGASHHTGMLSTSGFATPVANATSALFSTSSLSKF